jgi:dipeptidase E
MPAELLPQILALGGGGFSMEPGNPALDHYVLAQAPVPRPHIAFLATASGDNDGYIARFYAAFSRYDCRPAHLPLFQRTPELASFVFAQDILYVGGGNTLSMLGVWRAWGLPELLRTAWQRGVVLAGLSAGAICWFEQGLSDSYAGRLALIPGLGLLSGAFCPHYNSEPERRPAFRHLLSQNLPDSNPQGSESPPANLENSHDQPPAPRELGLAADDGVLLHFTGTRLQRILSSQPEAAAYRLHLQAGQLLETRLEAELLGGAGQPVSASRNQGKS